MSTTGVGVGVGVGVGFTTTVLVFVLVFVFVLVLVVVLSVVVVTPLLSVTLGKTTVPALVGSLVAPLESLMVTLSAA